MTPSGKCFDFLMQDQYIFGNLELITNVFNPHKEKNCKLSSDFHRWTGARTKPSPTHIHKWFLPKTCLGRNWRGSGLKEDVWSWQESGRRTRCQAAKALQDEILRPVWQREGPGSLMNWTPNSHTKVYLFILVFWDKLSSVVLGPVLSWS